jgi:hypothetical protein
MEQAYAAGTMVALGGASRRGSRAPSVGLGALGRPSGTRTWAPGGGVRFRHRMSGPERGVCRRRDASVKRWGRTVNVRF